MLSRRPSPAELAPLQTLLEEQLARFRHAPEAAEQLLGIGESPSVAGLSACELAACAVIANILLNLDEAITKG